MHMAIECVEEEGTFNRQDKRQGVKGKKARI
jgi:hypothetical protein